MLSLLNWRLRGAELSRRGRRRAVATQPRACRESRGCPSRGSLDQSQVFPCPAERTSLAATRTCGAVPVVLAKQKVNARVDLADRCLRQLLLVNGHSPITDALRHRFTRMHAKECTRTGGPPARPASLSQRVAPAWPGYPARLRGDRVTRPDRAPVGVSGNPCANPTRNPFGVPLTRLRPTGAARSPLPSLEAPQVSCGSYAGCGSRLRVALWVFSNSAGGT